MSESEEQSEQSKVDNYVLRVDPDELAFLKSYWELRDTREVFQWSLRMLYDLSKADEAGWRMALWKAKLDTEQDNVIINRNYRPAFLPLSLFAPSSRRYATEDLCWQSRQEHEVDARTENPIGEKAMSEEKTTTPEAIVAEHAQYKESLSEAGKKRLESIELAIGVLNEAKTPFMLISTADETNPGMKFAYSHRFTYSEDVQRAAQEMAITKEHLLPIALRHLSVGLKGGIAVFNITGTPMFIFQDGMVLDVKDPREQKKELLVPDKNVVAKV